jgi:hypothetical protein
MDQADRSSPSSIFPPHNLRHPRSIPVDSIVVRRVSTPRHHDIVK